MGKKHHVMAAGAGMFQCDKLRGDSTLPYYHDLNREDCGLNLHFRNASTTQLTITQTN